MDIKHLNDYVEMKKDIVGTSDWGGLFLEKRVALHNIDGQTHVVTDHEGGYYVLRDGNWEVNWDDKQVDDWNKNQGLTKDEVEEIIDYSMSCFTSNTLAEEKINRSNTKKPITYELRKVSYLEQLEKYKSKGYVLDTTTNRWTLAKSKQKDRPPR
jgi:hypothetical protein